MAAATAAAPSAQDIQLFNIQQKYAQEAAKRFRSDGINQYVVIGNVEEGRLRELAQDPWADHAALNAREPAIKDGAQHKFLVLGAGYGGLLFAARVKQAGLVNGPDDLRLVDNAGGFGGTWYWNRYPGLHCDVESYTYMPLLEETGYAPTQKYASGPELREHADRIATHFDLHDKTLFRSQVKTARWDEETQLWNVHIVEGRGPEEPSRDLHIKVQYVLAASGVLTTPQVPKIPGLESFSGSMFHTARWDYSISGGKPDDWALTGLEGKRVGILGTGATAIQVVPQVAKWAKELYVFQRTPSAVSERGQRRTDPEEWYVFIPFTVVCRKKCSPKNRKKIAYKKGCK